MWLKRNKLNSFYSIDRIKSLLFFDSIRSDYEKIRATKFIRFQLKLQKNQHLFFTR